MDNHEIGPLLEHSEVCVQRLKERRGCEWVHVNVGHSTAVGDRQISALITRARASIVIKGGLSLSAQRHGHRQYQKNELLHWGRAPYSEVSSEYKALSTELKKSAVRLEVYRRRLRGHHAQAPSLILSVDNSWAAVGCF